MKKIINKIGAMLEALLLAPVKLPGKVVNVIKYIAVGVGLIQHLLDEDKPDVSPAASEVSENPKDLAEPDRERKLGNEN